MVEIEWDGETLKARGTNKVSHFALLGQTEVDIDDSTNEDESIKGQWKGVGKALKDGAKLRLPEYLILNRGEFTVTKFTTGNPFTNGNLTLQTPAGKKYQFHFRRKSNDEFSELHQALRS
jgi:hypothetical protein